MAQWTHAICYGISLIDRILIDSLVKMIFISHFWFWLSSLNNNPFFLFKTNKPADLTKNGAHNLLDSMRSEFNIRNECDQMKISWNRTNYQSVIQNHYMALSLWKNKYKNLFTFYLLATIHWMSCTEYHLCDDGDWQAIADKAYIASRPNMINE